MASSARIDELRKKFDENPRRYFAPLANEYRKAGDLEQAIFICQEYLPQQPGHMSGHIVYGQALYDLNRHDEARTVFETALSLDPENLIALRHLGDIARQAGDAAAARAWYQRVLEADPRNEEIAALLASLGGDAAMSGAGDAGSEGGDQQPAIGSATEFGISIDDDATPLSTPTVPAAGRSGGMSIVDESADTFDVPPATGQASAGFAIEKSTEADFDVPAGESFAPPAFTPPRPPPPAPMPEPVPTTGDAGSNAEPSSGRELLDLDGFDLGGSPSPAEPEPASQPASETAAPEIELGADMVIGLPDDGISGGMPRSDAEVDGLETFEAGTLPEAPAEVMSLETETFFDLPASTEPPPQRAEASETGAAREMSDMPEMLEPATDSAEQASVEEPSSESEADAEPVQVFVTETMATLYLQQGHLESALDIYRQLVEQRPNDQELRERLRGVERQVHGQTDEQTAEAETQFEPDTIDEPIAGGAATSEVLAVPPRTYGGPTIREFLAGLVSRGTPASGHRAAMESGFDEAAAAAAEFGGAGESADFDAADNAAPPSAQSAPPERPARLTPSSSETVTGSIGALFGGPDTEGSETSAAQILADAFPPDTADTTPLEGRPARRASNELSLNHVFKSGGPQRPAGDGDGFSFDQFFADGAAEESAPAPDATPAPDAEGTDDIAQFNAWLNGLKKT